ncbi:hypothetical protein U1Q18_022427 [Sarracenia purpurea var. burkii]
MNRVRGEQPKDACCECEEYFTKKRESLELGRNVEDEARIFGKPFNILKVSRVDKDWGLWAPEIAVDELLCSEDFLTYTPKGGYQKRLASRSIHWLPVDYSGPLPRLIAGYWQCSRIASFVGLVLLELANPPETLEESTNQRVVLALYEALSTRDVDTVHRLLAADLEWWFHGPPHYQFMMCLLTGTATPQSASFHFVPQSVAAFGSTVLVEGCDYSRSISWVHAWTVTDGIITQVREYFNTSLTVTHFGAADESSPSESSPSSSSSITVLHCPSLWESSVSNQVGKSVPGLVLAI